MRIYNFKLKQFENEIRLHKYQHQKSIKLRSEKRRKNSRIFKKL